MELQNKTFSEVLPQVKLDTNFIHIWSILRILLYGHSTEKYVDVEFFSAKELFTRVKA